MGYNALNLILILTALAMFIIGFQRAGSVYHDAIREMQPHLSAIKKGMEFPHELE